ncbi:MAG: septation protein SepH [Rhodoglobus sp.]
MQDLKVIGVESGALLAAADNGTRFRIPIDEMMQSQLRKSVPDPGVGAKISPREIQAHIRSGMSAQDVASVTGISCEYIQRFEGPVLAEREFIVQSAQGVQVRPSEDADPMDQTKTFGTVIRERLSDLDAVDERWASWKESEIGWIVKLSFTAQQIDHDARWKFDPKKLLLSPLNAEAITLSQQGDSMLSMVPRLRVVSEPHPDSSRFDSGAFSLSESQQLSLAPVSTRASESEKQPASSIQGNQTSDLLEALRRRRGERESAHFDDAHARASHPSTGSVRTVDVQMDVFGNDAEESLHTTAPQPTVRRMPRASMPSWDDIVFGARPDDDPA